MENTYITRQGDAWDAIAFRVYGDCRHAGWLMEHNLPHLDTFVFDAGTVLMTPPLPAIQKEGLPIWRTEA